MTGAVRRWARSFADWLGFVPPPATPARLGGLTVIPMYPCGSCNAGPGQGCTVECVRYVDRMWPR